jgi:putative restriction endonuclease
MPEQSSPKATRPSANWTRDEVIIACGLYFTIPFGRMHRGNPTLIEISALLGRTPDSLAMKLTNLASLDPAHQARGIKGLPGHSKLDSQIWSEFQNNWDEMVLLSETSLQTLMAQTPPPIQSAASVVEQLPREGPTEIEATRKVRTMQTFFRKIVFAAYEAKCCVTGNPVSDLLVASHILPWSQFPKERLNPRNGLCLAAHFDRAFDAGLISFDENLQLIVSRKLNRYLPNEALQTEFLPRAGQRLSCPERFGPDPQFIASHRIRFELTEAG